MGQISQTRNFTTLECGSGIDQKNKIFLHISLFVRAAEESMIKRAHESFEALNGKNVLGDDWPKA